MPQVAIKPVYALVGPDPFLQTQRMGTILAVLGPDIQRVEFDGERAQLADVLDELRSFAMFGGAKVVIVRNADDFLTRFREQVEDYVASPSDSATLILRLSSLPSNQRIYKAIAKTGQIENCAPPKDKDLPQWVMQQARSAHALTLTTDAAAMLADLIGDDLGRIDSELAKLALMSDGKKLDAEQVSGAVTFQREREMWDMTNELAAGHPAEALRRWRQLLQLDSSAEFRAVTWLTMWLENVRKALAMKRQGMNTFAICSQLRVWPRENQDPFMKTVTTMGDGGARRALKLLARVDQQSKSGVGEAATNIERFILELANA